ncbi:MAG: helix-turn-helix domain-containing protein [Dehalococcoidales bacterium]|nr:helix-turn-helix domain-containing protein [Dehalococcoidales bacterium]
MENNKLTYSVQEASRLLGLSKNSTYQACLSGQIPCLRIGKRILIPIVKLDRMLNEGEEE